MLKYFKILFKVMLFINEIKHKIFDIQYEKNYVIIVIQELKIQVIFYIF